MNFPCGIILAVFPIAVFLYNVFDAVFLMNSSKYS